MSEILCMPFHGMIVILMVSKQFGLKYVFASENYLLVGFTVLLTQTTHMEHSLDQAFNQHIDNNILVTGDFNININSNPSNRISRLIVSLNSEQLINSPTYFTERSSSLIDLMFIKQSTQILSSFVADPFVSAPILTLIDETTKAESDEENADLLNTYFSKQSTIDTQ